MPKSAVVIGAGLAGIAVAIRLKNAGFNVTVLEKNATHGGKLAAFTESGYRWDKGPSLFTMPHLVDELFTSCNKDPRDYFSYTSFEKTCRYFFEDGTNIQFYTNNDALQNELTEKLSAEDAKRTSGYMRES